MPRTSHGLPGVYNASPITLNDGDGAASALDSGGRIILSPDSGGSANPDSSVVTSVNDSSSSVTLVAASTSAKERIIQNDSSSTLYVKFGVTASSTDYTAKLAQDDILTTTYTGRIDGIWSSDSTGAAKITELS